MLYLYKITSTTMKKVLLSAFAVGLFLLISGVVSAATFRTGEYLVIDEVINDDLYIAAGTADIDADINGDLYSSGGMITVNSTINQDLVVVGGRVTVLGNVNGDVRMLGGQLAVHGNVSGDVILIGGEVSVGSNSVVNGSVISAAGYLSILGEVKKNVQGILGVFILNGNVEGDVMVTIEDTLTVSENTRIGGDLSYRAILETSVPEGVVGGETRFNQFEEDHEINTWSKLHMSMKLFGYISALLLALIFVVLSPKSLIRSSEIIKERVIRAFGVGLLTLSAAIIGSLLLIVTIVGVPLALIIVSGLIISMYISKIFAAVWFGSYLVNFHKGRKEIGRLKLFGVMAGTLFIYYLVDLIPYVGWIINIILFLIGLGGIVLLKQEYLKFLRGKKMV